MGSSDHISPPVSVNDTPPSAVVLAPNSTHGYLGVIEESGRKGRSGYKQLIRYTANAYFTSIETRLSGNQIRHGKDEK